MQAKNAGYAMGIVGIAMILYNAYGYLTGQYEGAPAFSAMGIVFLAIGAGIVKKSRQGKGATA